MLSTAVQNSFNISCRLILSLILGGAYYNQPLTSYGAFTCGSVIFIGLLTIALDAFGEMPMQMIFSPVQQKQTAYSCTAPPPS
jgi:hypothetical protein